MESKGEKRGRKADEFTTAFEAFWSSRLRLAFELGLDRGLEHSLIWRIVANGCLRRNDEILVLMISGDDDDGNIDADILWQMAIFAVSVCGVVLQRQQIKMRINIFSDLL